MEDAIEILGYIISIGILLGVIGTTIWILIICFRSDPDFKDEEDQEIHERKFWDKK